MSRKLCVFYKIQAFNKSNIRQNSKTVGQCSSKVHDLGSEGSKNDGFLKQTVIYKNDKCCFCIGNQWLIPYKM